MKEITIFTDGGAIGNPGPGGWGAVISNQSKNSVREIGGSEEKTTNNRMEMLAVIEALQGLNTEAAITIHSDSKYMIQGITQWVFGWQQNEWKTKNKTDVLNKDLWERLVDATSNKNIEWKHVAGHVGIPGNERVDTIANSFARGKEVQLYNGLSESYTVDLKNTEAPEEAKKSGSKSAKAYSYLSMIDGEIQKHKTWAECEARVKGKKARFKKALSKEHEEEIISEWTS